MDPFLFQLLLPLLGLILVIALLKVMFEIVLPDLLAGWANNHKFKEGEKWRSDRELLQWLRKMKPSEFEIYIAELLKRLGYSTWAVGKSHDGGIDVEIEKDGVKSYIQCKKYVSSSVSVGEVRDFYGAIADKLAQGKAYFITTNKFTLEAERFAADKPIELIDGQSLIKYVKMAYKDGELITQTSNKTCTKCGNDMVERSGRRGKFLGCSTYPKCRHTESIE